MKLRSLTLMLSAFTLTAITALAQQANREIPGTYDPHTGTFHPRAVLDATGEAAAAPVIHAGELEFEFTIDVKSVVPTGDKVLCEATASVTDISGTALANLIEESASAIATIKGATATCTVAIPYSWSLLGTADTVSMGYSVDIVPASTTTALSGLFTRTSSQSLPAIPVPKTGTTTVKTISATI